MISRQREPVYGGLSKRLDVVAEFISALAARDTYNLRRNPYIIFGFLWGLPVPVLGALVELGVARSCGISVSLTQMFSRPFFLILLLHPLLFAVVFGAMGTVRLRKMANIKRLLDEKEGEMRHVAEAHFELQKLSRLKDEFLGAVTHELQTPLVTIRGYAEMFDNQRLGELSEQQQRALTAIRRNCERLQQQIELLLAASRSQSGISRMSPIEIPLTDLVHEVFEHHKLLAARKNLELKCRMPHGTVMLWGDYARLMEVLDNLVSNAIKFTDYGSISLLFGEPTLDRLPVDIVDTGCGIPTAAQAYVFERFRQADGSVRRRYGGAGLGLALVRENLLAHGCSIKLESEPGRGARFSFELPLLAVKTAADQDAKKGAAMTLHTKTIMTVDDEPDILELLQLLLGSAGFGVVTAAGGAEAIALLESMRPDLMLLDIMMPGVDGHAVCAAVRKRPELAGMPVLMLTAKNDVAHIAKALSAGADGFIVKPFDTEHLLELITGYLAGERPEFYSSTRAAGAPWGRGPQSDTAASRYVLLCLNEPKAEFSVVVSACEGQSYNLLSLWQFPSSGNQVATTALLDIKSPQQFGDLLNGVLAHGGVHVRHCTLYQRLEDVPISAMQE